MKQGHLFFLIFLIGCQPKLKTIFQDRNSGLACPESRSSYFKAENKKSFLNLYEQKKKKVIFTNPKIKSLLPKGFALSVLVDQECVLNSKKLSILTQELKKNILPRDFSRFSKQDTFSVQLPVEMSQATLDELVQKDLCIIGLSQESYARPASVIPNDPLFNVQSHMKTIRYQEIYEKSFSNAETKLKSQYTVAVVDTGYLADHEDLKNQWFINRVEANGLPNVDDDHNGIIDDISGANFSGKIPVANEPDSEFAMHGTHVSGFIGAETNNGLGISGIMGPNVKILPLALWPTTIYGNSTLEYTAGPMSKVAQAIRYATDMGANVINISMRGDDLSPNIEAALHYAVEHGVFVAVAAANDAKEIGVDGYNPVPAYYAKDIDGVMAVAAINSQSGLSGDMCRFSSYSPNYVEIAAPGCDLDNNTNYGGAGIMSCLNKSLDPTYGHYGFIQGTSMASPIVAGVAIYTYALLKEFAKIQNVTPALVESVIKNGSSVNPYLVGKTLGAKQIDMKSIYDYIDQTYVHVPPSHPPGGGSTPSCPD